MASGCHTGQHRDGRRPWKDKVLGGGMELTCMDPNLSVERSPLEGHLLQQYEEAKGQLEEVWDFIHEMSRADRHKAE